MRPVIITAQKQVMFVSVGIETQVWSSSGQLAEDEDKFEMMDCLSPISPPPSLLPSSQGLLLK